MEEEVGQEGDTSMTSPEPRVFEMERVATTAWPSGPTWRYLGDRAAADLAYCARFGTTEAPEPAMAAGGVWAYPLPATQARE